MKDRLSFPITKQQAQDLLLSAYKAEVIYRHRTFRPTTETLESIAKLADYLTNRTWKYGFMLCGRCGNGKSTLLKAFELALYKLESEELIEPTRNGMLIIHAKDICRKSHDFEEFRKIRSRTLLGIEDFGSEPSDVQNFGNVYSPLVDLIEYRYEYQLFTAITTNLTPGEIASKYDHRLADRLNEMMQVIAFRGDSFRIYP